MTHHEKVVRFEVIFKNTSHRLYSFIHGIVRNRSLVQDLMQQCYLKLWERFDTIDLERELLPLLYTYARNTVVDHLRKKLKEEYVADYQLWENELSDNNSLLDQISYKESEKNLHKVIDKMPAGRKQVFTLIKLQGLSYQQASLQLGISVSTIEKHMQEAYKFLAQWSSALFICGLLFHNDGKM